MRAKVQARAEESPRDEAPTWDGRAARVPRGGGRAAHEGGAVPGGPPRGGTGPGEASGEADSVAGKAGETRTRRTASIAEGEGGDEGTPRGPRGDDRRTAAVPPPDERSH